MRRLVAPLLLLLLAGCSTLPSAGPLVREVEDEAALKRRFPYEYVLMTPEIAAIAGARVPEVLEVFAPDLGAQQILISPGDRLTVTIVEAGAGGLYSAPPSSGINGAEQGARVVTLPEVTVDEAGRITVPFAGVRRVSGMTTTQAAQAIQASLQGQAINPQVTVGLVPGTGSRVVVGGLVRTPGLHVPQGNGETLLEAIALAGGTTDNANESLVQLNRGGQVYRIRMQSLLDFPSSNIHVRNGDYVHVYAEPRTYTVLGAADKPQEGALPINGLSLAEAISRAGGLQDARADAEGVLLARLEPRARMDRIWAVMAKEARLHGNDISGELAARAQVLQPGAAVPVLYRLDMRTGSGLFMARDVAMREKDLVFLPNAASTQVTKALDAVRLRFDIGTRSNP